MKNYFLSILTMLLGTFAFVSCSSDDEEPSTISVNTTTLAFSADGGSLQFTVTSNTTWQISGVGSWCTVSLSSGSNTQTIIVTATPNTTSIARNCILTVSTTDGKASTAVIISQEIGTGNTGDTTLAGKVAGTYVGKLMSGGEVVNDAYKIILTKLNSTSVEMDAQFFSEPTNFNVSESQGQYVLTNSNYTNVTVTVAGKVLNVSFVNVAGTMTTYSGTKD